MKIALTMHFDLEHRIALTNRGRRNNKYGKYQQFVLWTRGGCVPRQSVNVVQ